jgi:hypothetical protein
MRRKTVLHAGLAGVTAAACYAVASELASSKAVRISALFMAAAGGMAGMATNSVKARSLAARLDAHVAAAGPAINLQANGGSINGDVHVAGTLYGNSGTLAVTDTVQASNDVHVAGTLYGSGGSLQVGDSINCSGAIACSSVQNITLSQGSFLSSLSRANGIQAGGGNLPGGASLATCIARVNGIANGLINNGYATN